MAKVDGTVELPYITVDEPPGTYGHQGANPDNPPPSVPHWEPGENPPGTDPPIPPESDPALSYRAGTNPTVQTPPDREPNENDVEYERRAREFMHQSQPPAREPGDFEGDRAVGAAVPVREIHREDDYPKAPEPRVEEAPRRTDDEVQREDALREGQNRSAHEQEERFNKSREQLEEGGGKGSSGGSGGGGGKGRPIPDTKQDAERRDRERRDDTKNLDIDDF